ncbi:protein-export chaperone SecB [Sneathiella chinensis]|uniref:Protein-export protein SecB n=1 Tax=Sneathiella chinensis TaxID=349750 RepID=A0ABQ5U0S2_9PROT|nr:protein-export chaperone SecB [Sneathiella chinensis]GLQ04932.1 protein-export protein SecB [Sneathiella chinensis]
MSENEAGAGTPNAAEANEGPMLSIITQYIKDLSVENPNAPKSLNPELPAPTVELGVNVQAKALTPENFEVELRIQAKAKHGEETAFIVELVYGGLFLLKNFPQDAMEMMCMIECPRILFPFARRVISDSTRDAGFSPLQLDPIDFAGLFANHKATQGQAGNA